MRSDPGGPTGAVPLRRRTGPRLLGPPLLLAALTVAVFWPLGGFPFIGLDDPWYVFHNQRVLKGLSWDGVAWALTTLTQGNWHPLTWLSHLTDVTLFGQDAGKHHLVNLALHTASTVALFLLLTRLTGRRWPSWAVAALFGVHPLHVESVAWVAERKDVLSGLLFMLVIAAYLGFVRHGGRARYALVVVLYALGLTAKPMLVTLPALLLLLDWWPLGRLSADGRAAAWPARPVLEKIPLLLLSAASSAVTFVAQLRGGAMNMMESHYLGERAANAVLSAALYLVKTVWPARLSIFYPFPEVRAIPWEVAGAAALLVAITCAAVILRRRQPSLLMGWCWYLGTLVPVIGLVKVGLQGHADRYTYLPSIGLFVALAWAVWPRRPRAALVAVAASLALVAGLSVAARQQVQLWRDDTTLFSHSLAVNPDDWIAHFILGDAAVKQGRVNDGLFHFQEAVRLNPRYAEAQNDLGLSLALTGRPAEALAHVQEAARLEPNRADFAYNYGNLLANQGRADQALRAYNRAIELNPEFAEAHNNLGLLLLNTGRPGEAQTHFETALRIKPDFQQAQVNLRTALGFQRRGPTGN